MTVCAHTGLGFQPVSALLMATVVCVWGVECGTGEMHHRPAVIRCGGSAYLLSFPTQAIRVLGLLGALDPYKHKVNIGMIDQSRDASAVSLSESKSSQDSCKLETHKVWTHKTLPGYIRKCCLR